VSDIYQPPPPEWIAAPTPWAPESGWYGETGPSAPVAGPPVAGPPVAPTGEWPPPPAGPPAPPTWAAPPPAPSPEPRPRAGRVSVAIAASAALISALVGAGIGSQLNLHRSAQPTSSALPVTPTPGADPSAGATPAAPADPGIGGGSDPSGGPSTPVSPTDPNAGGNRVAPSGSSGAGVSAAAAAIAAKADPGIVDINTVLGSNGSAAGTGMILTPDGEILTNNHVVDGATRISVTLVTTGRTYRATVVGTDPTEDIAVVQLQGASGLTTISAGNSSAVAVGDSVVAVGNAGGVGGTPSVVTGSVTALNQTITASDQGGGNAETLSNLIQIDAPIQPGDSGGPLLNTSAKVIGIDTAASTGRRFSASGSEGFAIPINRALSIASQIESGNASATIHIGVPGFLGVAIAPAGRGGSATGGAVVAGVQAGSPAAAAGLAAGDAITSINAKTVDSSSTLSALTKAHRPGERVSVGWTDQSGAHHSATVTLATGPAD